MAIRAGLGQQGGETLVVSIECRRGLTQEDLVFLRNGQGPEGRHILVKILRIFLELPFAGADVVGIPRTAEQAGMGGPDEVHVVQHPGQGGGLDQLLGDLALAPL